MSRTYRLVGTQPGEVVATLNRTALLKFIGWCEAHRPVAEYESSFIGRCLTDLELAREGDTLNATITITCGGCGTEGDINSADMFYDPDAGGWFCNDNERCDQRRMGGTA